MGLRVNIVHNAEIDELIGRFSFFSKLKNAQVREMDTNYWYRSSSSSGKRKKIYTLQVVVIGKTGYGKSTTLNALVGRDCFETNDIEACTKKLYSAEYRLNKDGRYYLSFGDMPGIAESEDVDKPYYDWYREMIKRAQCVVYVLRADQNDVVQDKKVFKDSFSDLTERRKVVLALNYADKVEPINRQFGLTEQQKENLQRKVRAASTSFGVLEKDVIYYSAKDKINISLLANKISEKIDQYII